MTKIVWAVLIALCLFNGLFYAAFGLLIAPVLMRMAAIMAYIKLMRLRNVRS